jgi:CRISPR-associated exonuclease Cas4
MSVGWLALGVTLILLAVASWLWGRGQWEQSGLPEGELLQSDTGAWIPQSKPLYDPELRLTGRPDYLIRQHDGSLVPVELKAAKAPPEPHEGHILQLAAYCLLVESAMGVRPAYGILQYKDRAFAVDYTMELEDDLLDLLAEMHESLTSADLDRDHNDWHRCARCGVRPHCTQRLA